MNLTPTERRIYDLLRSDGLPHIIAEIRMQIEDGLAGLKAFEFHMTNLRAKLRPEGYAIAPVAFNGGTKATHYILVQNPATISAHQQSSSSS